MKSINYLRSFVVGATIHLIIWLITVTSDVGKYNLTCEESSCYFLILIDLPVSILYANWGRVGISTLSPIIGSMWWGVVFIIINLLIHSLKRNERMNREN